MRGWLKSASGLILPAAGGGGGGGIQFVGGREIDGSSWGTGTHTESMSGTLSGGLASSPQAGDFCVIGYTQAGTADRSNRSIANAVGEFNLLGTLYANDTNDVSITVKYKFLESPIDYDVIFGNPSSSGNGVNGSIQVFRGVNVTTPLDVAAVTASGTNTGLADPGSITPTTSGAVIGTFAAAGQGASLNNAFTSSDYDAFVSQGRSAAQRSLTSSFGRKAWTSGAFDAAAYGGFSVNAADSWVAVAFALRPA